MQNPVSAHGLRDLSEEEAHGASVQTSVYVYEAPVRLWHWINAAAIVALCLTGWFIGSPPPSMQIAEATHQFVFGYIRFAHFAAGSSCHEWLRKKSSVSPPFAPAGRESA